MPLEKARSKSRQCMSKSEWVFVQGAGSLIASAQAVSAAASASEKRSAQLSHVILYNIV